MHWFWLNQTSFGRERDEFVAQQEELEGVANTIIMKVCQAAGEL